MQSQFLSKFPKNKNLYDKSFWLDHSPIFFFLHRLHSDDRVTSDIDDHPLTGGWGPLTICPVCDANPRPGRLQPTQSQPYQYIIYTLFHFYSTYHIKSCIYKCGKLLGMLPLLCKLDFWIQPMIEQLLKVQQDLFLSSSYLPMQLIFLTVQICTLF